MENGIVVYFRRDSLSDTRAACRRCPEIWEDTAQVSETCPGCGSKEIEFKDRSCYKSGDIVDVLDAGDDSDRIDGDRLYLSGNSVVDLLIRFDVLEFDSLKNILTGSGAKSCRRFKIDFESGLIDPEIIIEKAY